jgi:hypothetical protein
MSFDVVVTTDYDVVVSPEPGDDVMVVTDFEVETIQVPEQGPPGPPGPMGPAGPSGIPTDAPIDGGTYGRFNGNWTHVLPLAGSTMTGPIVLAADPTAPMQAATKEYVDNQISADAGNSLPLMDGTASAGTSPDFSRMDHVHPSDTSRAPINSPAFTGVPTTATTPTAGDSSTKLATTAFVGTAIAAIPPPPTPPSPATAAPLMDGTAAVGTSLLYARQDHVHPSDTSRLALAGGTMTGALNMGAHQINGLSDPAVNTDAVTLQYLNAHTIPDAPADGNTYGRKNNAWVAGGGGSQVYIQDTPPSTTLPAGSMWWKSDTGQLFVLYNDGNSIQWVSAVAVPDSTNYVYRGGDTMTGPLNLSGDATSGYQAVSWHQWISRQPLFGYIGGLTSYSNSGTQITILTGLCCDSTGAAMIINTTAFTKTTAAWAAGSGVGATPPGVTIPSNGWFHVFACSAGPYGGGTTNVADFFFDTDVNGSHMPSGYVYKRRIGSIDVSSGAILGYVQYGDTFTWLFPSSPFGYLIYTNSGFPISGYALTAAATPPGVKCEVLSTIFATFAVASTNGSQINFKIYDPDMSSSAVASGACSDIECVFITPSGLADARTCQHRTFVAASNQNVAISMYGTGTGTQGYLYIYQYGWVDRRGRDGNL